MAQTNYTPISLYYSTTASAVPTAANLVPGELAINTNDGKLYYEDSSGVVQVLATKSTGSIGGSNTQVQFNNSGSLGGSSGLTWDGSFLTTSSIKNSALTSGRVTYAGASGLLSDSANLVWDNTNARLGIGTSSPSAKLEVYPGNVSTVGAIASSGLMIGNNSAVGNLSQIGFGYTTNTTNTTAYISLIETNGAGNSYGDLIFGTRSVTTDTAPTERMRITSAGNLGIGTSSPTTLLQIDTASSGANVLNINGGSSQVFNIGVSSAGGGPFVYVTSNHALRFGTNDTERMRIDSSGNLLVGTTSADGIGWTIYPTGYAVTKRSGTAATTHMSFQNDNGQVGFIQTSGSLTIFGTTSDYRLKTVIGAVTGQGVRIDALKPVEYTWNSNGSRTRGFLAHQFQEVYAGSVTGKKDAVDSDGNPLYQGMQASTSEVIADLVAEIQSLRQRIATLENK